MQNGNGIEEDTVYQKIDQAQKEIAAEKYFNTQEALKRIPVKNPRFKKSISFLIIFAAIVLGCGLGALIFTVAQPKEDGEKESLSVSEKWKTEPSKTLSPLTGEELENPSLSNLPTFCVQIPNGLDGARPQVGLNEAGVIFEAIAEAGITRLAAIFQNPTSSIIGPIRSLRMYYLEWDTPFDCTIVHAGGADDAIKAVSSGKYRDLTENYAYMWRGNSYGALNRQWNNLFTSANYLKSFNETNGFTTSNIKSFQRETKKNAEISRVKNNSENPLNIDSGTESSVNIINTKVNNITINYGGDVYFNPTYAYNSKTNSYDRFYNGEPHMSYNCTGELGEVTPEETCGEPTQISPKVVIAIKVNETKAADGYHESITTIGSGEAYIFQNGEVIDGFWEKSSRDSQIIFKDEKKIELKLIPGQTWISAIPTYGTVTYN